MSSTKELMDQYVIEKLDLIKVVLIDKCSKKECSKILKRSNQSINRDLLGRIFEYSVNTGKPAFYPNECTDKQALSLLRWFIDSYIFKWTDKKYSHEPTVKGSHGCYWQNHDNTPSPLNNCVKHFNELAWGTCELNYLKFLSEGLRKI